MINVCIINGKSRSGKDEFIKLVQKNFTTKKSKLVNGIINISTVDWIKKFCKIQHNIDPNNKSNKNRLIWHKEKLRHNKYIFHKITKKISLWQNYFYFIHSREIKDIQNYKKKYDNQCITLLIDNPNNNYNTNHNYDLNIKNFNYDLIIKNDKSINHLEKKAIDFIDSYIK